jgi:hypothetical protein
MASQIVGSNSIISWPAFYNEADGEKKAFEDFLEDIKLAAK